MSILTGHPVSSASPSTLCVCAWSFRFLCIIICILVQHVKQDVWTSWGYEIRLIFDDLVINTFGFIPLRHTVWCKKLLLPLSETWYTWRYVFALLSLPWNGKPQNKQNHCPDNRPIVFWLVTAISPCSYCLTQDAQKFSRNTNKMQLCNRNYYSKVYWRLNMFRAAHRSSSGALNCVCSLWFIYTCGDRPLPKLSGKFPTQPWQRPVTTWVYKPETANTV